MRIACTLALLALTFCSWARAEVHEVKMLNRGQNGSMVYDPDFLRIAPGDSVRFVATHSSHNAASIGGLWPEGVTAVKGRINEPLEFTPQQPGFYGIQCIPHVAMGMVMLIEVGTPAASLPTVPATLPQRARDRLDAILARAGSAR